MTFDDYMSMESPWLVLRAAQHDDTALDAAVARVLDTALEWMLDYRHLNPGWPPVSVTAKAGESPGGQGKRVDTMLIASMQLDKDSDWHRACRHMLSGIPIQHAGAMMIQAARVRPDKEGTCWWSKRASELFAQQDEALQRVGMRGIGIKRYPSVQAMQHAGREGRKALRESIKNRLGIKDA
jgi:hypothetical protein